MAPRYFPSFPMRAELTKFWSLTFFLGGGGAVGKEHMVLKIFPIISTLLE